MTFIVVCVTPEDVSRPPKATLLRRRRDPHWSYCQKRRARASAAAVQEARTKRGLPALMDSVAVGAPAMGVGAPGTGTTATGGVGGGGVVGLCVNWGTLASQSSRVRELLAEAAPA